MRTWKVLIITLLFMAGCLDANDSTTEETFGTSETTTTSSESEPATQEPAEEPEPSEEPQPQQTKGTEGQRGTPRKPVNPDALVAVLDESFAVSTLETVTYSFEVPEGTAYVWLHYNVDAGVFVEAVFNSGDCVDVSHYSGPTITAGGPTVNSGSISIRSYYLCGTPTAETSEVTISVAAGAFTGQLQMFADAESNYAS